MTYCDLLDSTSHMNFSSSVSTGQTCGLSALMPCVRRWGADNSATPGGISVSVFCAGCSPDFGFLRADALDHHRAASPEPLVGRCEASLGFGCAGCWFLSFQSCHNWQCHTLEFLGGLGPPKNIFSFVDIYEVTIYMYLCRYLIRVDIVYNQYCM